MDKFTVDASVWVSAHDRQDARCGESRRFLTWAVAAGAELRAPAFARVEIACALARRLRDPDEAVRLTETMLAAAQVVECDVDARLLSKALSHGTRNFLRGADALYAAAAETAGSTLVSWDGEHLNRAGAIRPTDLVS